MIGVGRREQDIRKELSGSTLSLPVLEIQILSPTKPMCFDTSANWCFFSSNSNSIATKFQISLWNLRINTNLFPIDSFILFYNLLSQHKSFGRWTIGEQKDLHQNGISAKVGRVATELRRSNIVEASYNSRFLTLALRLHASFSHPGITPLHHLKIPHFADESITSQRLKPKLFR